MTHVPSERKTFGVVNAPAPDNGARHIGSAAAVLGPAVIALAIASPVAAADAPARQESVRSSEIPLPPGTENIQAGGGDLYATVPSTVYPDRLDIVQITAEGIAAEPVRQGVSSYSVAGDGVVLATRPQYDGSGFYTIGGRAGEAMWSVVSDIGTTVENIHAYVDGKGLHHFMAVKQYGDGSPGDGKWAVLGNQMPKQESGQRTASSQAELAATLRNQVSANLEAMNSFKDPEVKSAAATSADRRLTGTEWRTRMINGVPAEVVSEEGRSAFISGKADAVTMQALTDYFTSLQSTSEDLLGWFAEGPIFSLGSDMEDVIMTAEQNGVVDLVAKTNGSYSEQTALLLHMHRNADGYLVAENPPYIVPPPELEAEGIAHIAATENNNRTTLIYTTGQGHTMVSFFYHTEPVATVYDILMSDGDPAKPVHLLQWGSNLVAEHQHADGSKHTAFFSTVTPQMIGVPKNEAGTPDQTVTGLFPSGGRLKRAVQDNDGVTIEDQPVMNSSYLPSISA